MLRYRDVVGCGDGARLYEIPTTSPPRPPRKPMRRMALQERRRASRGARVFRIDLPQSGFQASPQTTRVSRHDQENAMLDIIMLALGLGFFVLAIGYTYACERL